MYVKYVLVFTTIIQVKQTYRTPHTRLCGNGYCGQISYDEILRTYHGIFFTDMERREREHTIRSVRKSDLHREGVDTSKVLGLPGDGDSCCATEFHYIKNITMTNMRQETRSIVHLTDAEPPVYQLIPVGSCVPGYGSCEGHCFMEPLFLNLLVWDPSSTNSPPLTFDWFQVPGYCSCKNVQPSDFGGSVYSQLKPSLPDVHVQ